MRLLVTFSALVLACAAGCGDGGERRDVVDECHAGSCPTMEDPVRTATPPSTPSPTAELPGPTAAATSTVATAATATAIPTGSGRLQGYVHIGPTCPVVREGEDCDDRPHEAEMDIVDANGGVLLTVQSDAAGRFAATLPPGAYLLVPATDGRLPYASEQQFVIEAGRVTEVDVAYDSGIR